MIATTALALVLSAGAGASPAGDAPGKLLLCRPRVLGDAALARAAAVSSAARAPGPLPRLRRRLRGPRRGVARGAPRRARPRPHVERGGGRGRVAVRPVA